MRPAPTVTQVKVAAWINGQLDYFRKRIGEREQSITFVNDATWFLFMAALGLAAGLIDEIFNLLPGFTAIARSSFWWPVLAAAILLSFATSQLSTRMHSRRMRRAFAVLHLLPALYFGLLLAATIGEATALQEWLRGLVVSVTHHPVAPKDMGHKLVALITVLTATIAGATRFVIHSLAWEAELHSYREALGVFTRAKRELIILAETPEQAPPLTREQRNLLFDLGRIALAENESWIRAHRVRRLEPMP
jgi:hypothetical protein